MSQDGEDQHDDGGDGDGFNDVDDEYEDDNGDGNNGVVDTGFQCSGHLRIQAQWGVEPGCCLQRGYICIFGW